MYQTNIETLAAHTLKYLTNLGYSKQSLKARKNAFDKIIELHKQQGCVAFNPLLLNLFIEKTNERYANKEFSKCRYRFLIKTTEFLKEYHDTGQITHRRYDSTSNLNEHYTKILNEVLSYYQVDEQAHHRVWSVSKTFFKWLQARDMQSLNQINENIIREYIIDCANRMSKSSLDSVKNTLKTLFVYLYDTGVTTETYEKLFAFSVQIDRKIKRPIPLSEITAVLNVIDRSTPIGMRNYAIILLAIVTGLRAVDIRHLKLSDIDWINGEIKIIQEKTGNPIALPLTTDVGEALKIYILSGRPCSDEPYVFLREKTPHTLLGRSIPYSQFNRYRLELGLPKVPFHSLRRTLGTNMVIAEVPITTVAQVLGHAEINSTKQYISLDSIHLKECALSFDDLYTEMEEVEHNV